MSTPSSRKFWQGCLVNARRTPINPEQSEGTKLNFGIVVFPGTWSDTDCHYAVTDALGQKAEFVWHRDTDLSRFDCVILPGGFSYGD